MKIAQIIEQQIANIYGLGLEPVEVRLHEHIYDQFIEECKALITTSTDKPAIQFEVAKFMDLPIYKTNYSNMQFTQSEGFVSPIQVTVKTYHKTQ